MFIITYTYSINWNYSIRLVITELKTGINSETQFSSIIVPEMEISDYFSAENNSKRQEH